MRKYCLFVLLAAISLVASAQTQHGVVKTRGRMVNGKLVPGDKIPNALVSVRGRSAVLSNANGSFSFSVANNSFIIDSVKKKDYALIDIEACRQYRYPQSPFVLLMEKPELQRADMLAKERNLRRDLQKRLQKREDEVDSLNVSLEEKTRLLEEINQQRQENEKLIKDLAKYYATLDYDQLDEFQRRVSDCLENGELELADSLLRSRGSMEKRIAEIFDEEAAVAKEKEEALQRLKVAETIEAGTSKKKELAAADCYSFYQRFAQDHQRDSAAYYLELRASLDTTNVEWQNKAGIYIERYLADYSIALEYFQRELRQSLKQFGEQNDWTAAAYNNVGSVYDYQGDYAKALEYYSKALDITEKVLDTEHLDVATSYNNIGGVYYHQGYYVKALEYYSKVLDIREKVLGTEHPDVAQSYNNIGLVYVNQGDYAKALEYHSKALDIREKVLGAKHPDVATSYNNIGLVYSDQGDYAKALEYLSKALDIWEKVLGTEHPDVATSYNNIGYVYSDQGDYAKALEYLSKALDIWEKVLGTEHPNVATSFNNIGYVYSDQGDYAKALEYLSKALDIWEKVLGTEHPQTKQTMNDVEYMRKYIISQDPVKMQEHVFTATVIDGDTPARRQGMSGEYIVLEYADWTIKETSSLIDKKNEMREKPKDIVVMIGDTINSHHFENTIGISLGLKQVGKAEKNIIIKAYEDWKAKSHRKKTD